MRNPPGEAVANVLFYYMATENGYAAISKHAFYIAESRPPLANPVFTGAV